MNNQNPQINEISIDSISREAIQYAWSYVKQSATDLSEELSEYERREIHNYIKEMRKISKSGSNFEQSLQGCFTISNESINRARKIKSTIKLFQKGNCNELSYLAFMYLRKYNISAEIVSIVGYDHVFVVINRANSDLQDPSTWGEKCIICDPLNKMTYSIKEIEHKLKGYKFPHTVIPYSEMNKGKPQFKVLEEIVVSDYEEAKSMYSKSLDKISDFYKIINLLNVRKDIKNEINEAITNYNKEYYPNGGISQESGHFIERQFYKLTKRVVKLLLSGYDSLEVAKNDIFVALVKTTPFKDENILKKLLACCYIKDKVIPWLNLAEQNNNNNILKLLIEEISDLEIVESYLEAIKVDNKNLMKVLSQERKINFHSVLTLYFKNNMDNLRILEELIVNHKAIPNENDINLYIQNNNLSEAALRIIIDSNEKNKQFIAIKLLNQKQFDHFSYFVKNNSFNIADIFSQLMKRSITYKDSIIHLLQYYNKMCIFDDEMLFNQMDTGDDEVLGLLCSSIERERLIKFYFNYLSMLADNETSTSMDYLESKFHILTNDIIETAKKYGYYDENFIKKLTYRINNYRINNEYDNDIVSTNIINSNHKSNTK